MLKQPKPHWGGARQGAGRKPQTENSVRVSIFISEAERDTHKLLGGTRWIQDQIKKFQEGAMKSTIDTSKLTEEEQDLFVEGWKDAGGYVGDLDTDCPWCCPWDWGNPELEVTGTDIKDWGRQHWEACREEIECNLKQEA